jgi:hypothetical protein
VDGPSSEIRILASSCKEISFADCSRQFRTAAPEASLNQFVQIAGKIHGVDRPNRGEPARHKGQGLARLADARQPATRP